MLQAGTYGDFTEPNDDPGLEGLTIVFSPTSSSLKARWKNNSLSADFMGDYFSTFCPVEQSELPSRRDEVKSAVSYIANELLENHRCRFHSDRHTTDHATGRAAVLRKKWGIGNQRQ